MEIPFRDTFDETTKARIALENEVLALSDSKQTADLIEKKIEWGTLIDEVFATYNNGNPDKAMEIMSTKVRPLELTDGFQKSAGKREALIKEMM